MRTVLVLGASGFLGPHLIAAARAAGRRVLSAGRGAPPAGAPQADEHVPWDALGAMAPRALERLLDVARPEALVSAAALARVEECERDPARARALNAELPGALANLCRTRGVRLVQLSTDLVFGAARPADGGFREEDAPAPVHEYGRSKAAGEARVLRAWPDALVVRLPLLYGDSFGRGLGASDQVLAALARGERPALFSDEWRTPLEAGDAASAVLELAGGDARGLLHVGGPERLTRWELGQALLAARGLAPDAVRAVRRAELALAGPRPEDVSLDSRRARARLGLELRAPRAALAALP